MPTRSARRAGASTAALAAALATLTAMYVIQNEMARRMAVSGAMRSFKAQGAFGSRAVRHPGRRRHPACHPSLGQRWDETPAERATSLRFSDVPIREAKRWRSERVSDMGDTSSLVYDSLAS